MIATPATVPHLGLPRDARAHGLPLYLADGEPVMEVRPGPALRAVDHEGVQPLVAREGKR